MIACLYPRPILLFTSGTARTASVFVADRCTVRIFLTPKLYLVFLGAFDAPLAHFLVVFNLCFRKFTVFPEDNVEAQSENAQSYKDESC